MNFFNVNCLLPFVNYCAFFVSNVITIITFVQMTYFQTIRKC
jgi:hypothetical protein